MTLKTLLKKPNQPNKKTWVVPYCNNHSTVKTTENQ